MKRIYVIVEGQTEREFVLQILAPYFGAEGITISPVPMLKSGGGMGFSNLEHFKNNVKPLLFEKDQPIISTLVDLFRFPVQSGVPDEEKLLKQLSANVDIDVRLSGLQSVLFEAVQKINPYPNFIPYIQKYEFEALLFSNPEAFSLENESIQKAVADVTSVFPNPEDINTSPSGHPAQRLIDIYATHNAKYEKGADAVDIAELIGIEVMLEKCPRFRDWVETLFAKAAAP